MRELKVDGMSCNHCVEAVSKALEKIGGRDISVDLDSAIVKLEIDQADDKIVEAIEDIGFEILEIK